MPYYTAKIAGPAPTAEVTVWVEDDTTSPDEIWWEIGQRIEELDEAGKIDWELGDSIDAEVMDFWIKES